jgi:hypothetical protein
VWGSVIALRKVGMDSGEDELRRCSMVVTRMATHTTTPPSRCATT